MELLNFQLNNGIQTKKRRKIFAGVFSLLVVVLLLLVFYLYLVYFPLNVFLQKGKIVVIPVNSTITCVAELLETEHIISSKDLMRWYMVFKHISPKSGPYYFDKTINFFDVAERISTASYGDVYQTVTIPEGSTNEQIISILLKSSFPIHEDNLRKLLDSKEGFLFPDTYLFLPEATEEEIVTTLENTFKKKFKQAVLKPSISKKENEIVTMASLLEKEASNDLREKQIISGILWKRISIGMPLQVDAPFLYERGKVSSELSHNDLQKDSPYNTYTNKGLPPTPIGNPGYDALYAAVHPIDTNYLFYLHDSDGVIHYGRNHSEHLKNVRSYLR